jgi:hypothetical protein
MFQTIDSDHKIINIQLLFSRPLAMRRLILFCLSMIRAVDIIWTSYAANLFTNTLLKENAKYDLKFHK